MNKRIELNLEVKLSIANSLFLLMQKNPISAIKIVDIVRKAGVARASFYRNFKSREDVVEFFLMYMLTKYKEKFAPDIKHITRFENLRRTFSYIIEYKEQLQALFLSGMSQYLLKAINCYIIEKTEPKVTSLEQRYSLYTYSGALFNVIYIWISGGAKEDASVIAKIFYQSLKYENQEIILNSK